MKENKKKQIIDKQKKKTSFSFGQIAHEYKDEVRQQPKPQTANFNQVPKPAPQINHPQNDFSGEAIAAEQMAKIPENGLTNQKPEQLDPLGGEFGYNANLNPQEVG